MFSPICFTNFSQFERAIEEENKLLVCPSVKVLVFLSLPVEKKIRRFGIRDW
jgi:hypothetical protein